MDSPRDDSARQSASRSSTSTTTETGNSRGRPAPAGPLSAASDNTAHLLAFSADAAIRPGAHTPERERVLWDMLTQARGEIQELQSQIRELLGLNLRYAEQLHHALAAEPARKRPRTGSLDASPPQPLPAAQAHRVPAPLHRRHTFATPEAGSSAPRHSYQPMMQAPAAHIALPSEPRTLSATNAAMFPGGDVLVAPVPLRAVNPGRLVRPPVTAADTAAYAVAAAPRSQPPPPAAAPRTPFVEISDLAIGDAEAIPSIGRFRSLRALYQFRQRVSEYEHEHGRRWRERMESRRRQNWSRISAIYNRIVQLCGPDGSDAGVERALQAAEREMEASGATLTRYSQIVRKQLNRERRQSLQEASPSHGPAAPARHHPGSGSGSDASGLPVAGLAI